jgi:2-hydroxy-6-oxonona-2,4-dienedioate hydrolase
MATFNPVSSTPAAQRPIRSRRRWRNLGFVFIALLSVLAAGSLIGFRNDIGAARARALSGSTIVRTDCGLIEYATTGSGDPVLSIHGTGGGWDQGLSLADGLVAHGYRVIAPSRFGYLRTPMAPDASPQKEADQFRCLLDSLGLERVSVISASAGAAPALQFALRYPERVSSLVLLVPGPGGLGNPDPPAGVPPFIFNVVLGSDLPFWVAMKIWPKSMLSIVAVPAALVPTLAPEDRKQLNETIAMLLPVTSRRQGILYDARVQGSTPRFELERITVPTLLVSAEDDLYKTLPTARTAAAAIPGARLIEYQTGGHLLLGRDKELWPEVANFMRAALPIE